MSVIQAFLDVLIERWDAILTGTLEHLYLSFVSVAIATCIAVPLGIILTRKQRIAEPIIGITGLFQTIPSLALLAFMLPIFGIGVTPAIIALTIYSLLPILRNTYTGILGVDRSAVEAGKGMGMTNFQILYIVELPLSLPIIMAGIRTATVLTIGVASLAAFIGAGGLGELMFRGLQMMRNDLVLAGAIPAALLAIFFDLILRWVEVKTTPRGLKK
ncbi:ABC transporter permease [Hazenella sp. IB182357]|uniref:ABC transporter permease n=1 Tax=Polycladospora coralii TaxID=2771432 RepID=A0A926RVE2_9BACL|nr:ABC transporter permease [Polycladospora coralii]MBD1373499.1 ABC transporter permease [Polycladospora coralii]